MTVVEVKPKDRIVFRVSAIFYAAIAEQADAANRSINGEICTAVDKWLYERDKLVVLKDRLLAGARADTIMEIRRATPSFLTIVESDVEERKTNVRFKDTVEADLRASWAWHKSQQGHVSLNSFLKLVVAWWLAYSFQLAECAKAIHRDFKSSCRSQSVEVRAHIRPLLILP